MGAEVERADEIARRPEPGDHRAPARAAVFGDRLARPEKAHRRGRGALAPDDFAFTVALLAALREGKLAGAVLDVFEREPLPPEHPFWSMEQVIVTPHLAGPDEVEVVAQQFVANYRRFVAGEPLVGLVDRELGY